jgi:hypothetical protein
MKKQSNKNTKQITNGFKAFDINKDGKMICRDFVYEEGKTYVYDGETSVCERGFHFCKNPLDVLNYYPIVDDNMNIRSSFAEVKAYGEIDEEGDKCCSAKIEIGVNLNFACFIDTAIKTILNLCKTKSSSGDDSQLASSGDRSKLASSGDDSQLASSGDCSQLASSGDCSKLASSGNDSKLASSGNCSQLASSGNYSKLASSGDRSQLASSGDRSKLASSGDCSQLASSGDCSQLASSGNYSQLASSGNYSKLASSGNDSKLASSGDRSQLASSGNDSKLASSGNYSQLASSGNDCVIAGIGYKNIAKGKIGSWIVLSEYETEPPFNIKMVKVAQIDGKEIKADTFYKLENGDFVEMKS